MYDLKKIVRKIIAKRSSLEFLSRGGINNFTLSKHVIKRMFDREVSPEKLIEVLDNGKQYRDANNPTHFKINLKKITVFLDNASKKIVTVEKEDKFLNWSDDDFQRKKFSFEDDVTTSAKEITVKELRSIKTLAELKNLSGVLDLL